MAIVGTYRDNHAFDKTRISLMCRETAGDSIEKLQEDVRHFTPKDTGKLWESVSTRGPARVSTNIWSGEVYSDLEYAASIEYGWVNRVITPKKPGGWLHWQEKGNDIFAKKTKTSYMPGSHMFSKGANYFEHNHAEDIAERNAKKWLGTVDAGRRTVVL